MTEDGDKPELIVVGGSGAAHAEEQQWKRLHGAMRKAAGDPVRATLAWNLGFAQLNQLEDILNIGVMYRVAAMEQQLKGLTEAVDKLLGARPKK